MRYDNNLRYAIKMIGEYKGKTPLAVWLKEFFRKNKQMGSSDRKIISEMMYCYYRLGHSTKHLPADQKLLAALFVCNTDSHPVLQHLHPGWDLQITEPIAEKLMMLKKEAGMNLSNKIFPYKDELSDDIDPELFELSFLLQPKLFIRIRPGKKEVVLRKLNDAKADYSELADDCLSLPNGSRIDTILNLDEDAVVQDYNSRQTANLLKLLKHDREIKVWDCCAASGGKSIMAWDTLGPIYITVSDKRKLILENLKARFLKAGITNYNSFVADLSKAYFKLPAGVPELFDLIICDAPCTGSGTWSRSPEQLYFFDPSDIEKYSLLQKQIIDNVVPFLAPGGKLIYITCSVFKKENEEVVGYMSDYLQLKIEKATILKGYDMQADTMFVAQVSIPPEASHSS